MNTHNFFKAVTQFLAPAYCAYCKEFLSDQAIFCAQCSDRIKPVVSTQVSVTKTKSVRVFAVSAYQDPLKRLILAKGWSKPLASKQMADIIWHHTVLSHVTTDLFIPIPLHWTRFAWRGYNQAELMAERLAALSGKPTENILKRVRRTQSQFYLGSDDREKNLENVFSLTQSKKELLKNKHIVLVDDLMTTGATLKSAAKVLFSGKPASISAVVTCRVI